MIANNAADAANRLDIVPDGASPLVAVLTKRLDAPWAEGSGLGGLDTGSKVASATYHVFLIRSAAGTYDALLSAAPVNPVVPAGWAIDRVLGAILTDEAGAIRAFKQMPEGRFRYVLPPVTFANLPNSGVFLRNVTVPFGVKVEADLLVNFVGETSDAWCILQDPDEGVPQCSAAYARDNRQVAGNRGQAYLCWTNASAQVYTGDTAANAVVTCRTRGWRDPRVA